MREKHGTRFGVVSILNHWIVAILFLSVLSLGFVLDFFGDGRALRGPWMEAHKAAGVILLMFAIWRICWRLLQGFPQESTHMPAWQSISAKLVHWLLLFAIVAMPISGILLSLYGERGINVFGLFVIPPRPENDFISNASSVIHETLAYLVSGVIFMHVGAVVKHHLIDKDDTLHRMLSTKPKIVAAKTSKVQPKLALPVLSQSASAQQNGAAANHELEPRNKSAQSAAVASENKEVIQGQMPKQNSSSSATYSASYKNPAAEKKAVVAATYPAPKAHQRAPGSDSGDVRKTTLAERIPSIQRQLARDEKSAAERKIAAENKIAAEKPIPLKVRLATKSIR